MPFWFHKYPGTNFHEQNIDWLMEELKKTANDMKEFEIVNELYYAGAWDITKQYKRYSVVVDNNLGYMSIKDVPAGIQLTNTDYWVQVSDFTPQLANLGSRVSILEGKVSTLENDVSMLKDITKSWAGRKVLWVGDSYGNGWDGTTSVTDPYTTASNDLGCQFVNISHGGCRFGTNATDPQYLYQTYITDYVSNHTDMNTFTDVIIIGGANDIVQNPTADLYDRIGSVISYVNTHFPNARVIIGMVARLINTGYANCTYGNVYKIRDQYYKGAVGHGAVYLAGSELINHDYRDLASDSLHLSTYISMGHKLAQLLSSGDFCRNITAAINYEARTTDTADDLAPSTITFSDASYRGNEVIIDMTDLSFNFDTPITITWRHPYKFCKISGTNSVRNLFAASTKALKYNVVGIMSYKSGDDTYHSAQPFTIYFYDDYLYISWEGMTHDAQVNGVKVRDINIRTGLELIIDEADC